jgi:hypothetical protein
MHTATLTPEALKGWEDYIENASGSIRELANGLRDFQRSVRCEQQMFILNPLLGKEG